MSEFTSYEEQLQAGETITCFTVGDSMEPLLYNRSTHVFVKKVEGDLRRNDLPLYKRPSGQYVMHRVYQVDEDGTMTMAGDAQWTLEPGIRPDQLRAFVPRVVRKEKEISCEKGFWHRAMTLYLLRIRFPRLARLGLRVLRIPFAIKRKLFGNKKS